MNLGVIGFGTLGVALSSSLKEKGYSVTISDKNEDNFYHKSNIEVIRDSEIIFCCVDTTILPSNIFDIKNVMDVVEDIGVAFEEEIPLSEKIFVVCSTLNPGDTKEINDILSPFNLRVCYLPIIFSHDNVFESIKNQTKIIIGSIDNHVVNQVGTVISNIQKQSSQIISMTSKSAEILKLSLESYVAYKINFANFMGEMINNSGLTDEMGLIMSTLSSFDVVGDKNFKYGFGFGGPNLPAYNRVLGNYCNNHKLNFVLPYVIEDFNTQHNDYLKQFYVSQNEDRTEPFIIDGIGYKNNSTNHTESPKLKLVYDLLNDGFTVHILESKENFTTYSKLIKEMENDFGSRVKFFVKGTVPKGIYINL